MDDPGGSAAGLSSGAIAALRARLAPMARVRRDTIHSGAIVRLGTMQADVTGTGMNTMFGKTAALVAGSGSKSHFQQAVLRIGNFLMIVAGGLITLIVIGGLLRHASFGQTLKFAPVLTVAAIPVCYALVWLPVSSLIAVTVRRLLATARQP